MTTKGQTSMSTQRRVAEAAIVPGRREPPPPTLNLAEAAIWREIVERLPSDWFTAENRPLLKELCRHIGHADALSADVAQVRATLAELAQSADDDSGAEARRKAVNKATSNYHALLRLHAFQTERIGNLATKLRLSQQARLPPGKATPKADALPAGPKPWQDWHDLEPETRQ